MITAKQINKNVQNALIRKRNALNKLNLESNEPISKMFDANTQNNPFEQQHFRNCFAKVSVAVPDPKTQNESEVVKTPLSIASYFNTNENNKLVNSLDSFEQDNGNVAFVQGFKESADNRFRGHSGITKIAVAQQGYTTHKTTVDWYCPDPVYFEQIFEPAFLKMGAYCAIEFGWGIDDRTIEGDLLPALTIETMRDAVKNGVETRNQRSAGNYYFNTGIVTKFDWKIGDDGSYSGNLQILSRGASMLLNKTQESNQKSDEVLTPVQNIIEKERLRKQLLSKQKELTKEEYKELAAGSQGNQDNYIKLFQNSISFQSAMRNLDDVIDEYLPESNETSIINEKDNPYSLPQPKSTFEIADETIEINLNLSFSHNFDFQFKDGALKIKGGNEFFGGSSAIGRERSGRNEKINKDRYFISWGWFEDIMLNSFFELSDKDGILQQVRSTKTTLKTLSEKEQAQTGETKNKITKPTTCNSALFMYTNGLDGTILPKKHHPIQMEGFKSTLPKNQRDNPQGRDLEKLKRLKYVYDLQSRIDMTRVYHMFKIIDDNFKPFEIKPSDESNLGTGVIRNMVFPIEMYQKHFENMSSLRQGLRNFWADVNNQYAGFWNFKIGEDENIKGKIGVTDVDKEQLSLEETQGDERIVGDSGGEKFDFNKMFVFNVYSKDSIVKEFDITLDLSEEAATLAAYGHFSNVGVKNANSPADLPIEAWSILNKELGEKDITTKEQLERFRELTGQKIGGKLSVPTDNDGKGKSYEDNYDKEKNVLRRLVNEGLKFNEIKDIKEDTATEFERIETERFHFIDGIGLYDRNGNMSNYFKQIMTYLITSSTENGSGSKIQKGRLVLPISLTMTIDGVGGLRPGDSFRVDYLPRVYRENCYFMTTKVDHNLDKTGWTTDISAVLKVDLLNYWIDKVDRLDNTLLDLKNVFKFTNTDNFNVVSLEVFGVDFNETIEKMNQIVKEATETLPKQFDNSGDIKKAKIFGKIKRERTKLLRLTDEFKKINGLRLNNESIEQLEKVLETANINIEQINKLINSPKFDRYNMTDQERLQNVTAIASGQNRGGNPFSGG